MYAGPPLLESLYLLLVHWRLQCMWEMITERQQCPDKRHCDYHHDCPTRKAEGTRCGWHGLFQHKPPCTELW